MQSHKGSGHVVHVAAKVTELAMNTAQGQATVAAATGLAIAAAPVVVPVAIAAAVGYSVFRGICMLGEMLDS